MLLALPVSSARTICDELHRGHRRIVGLMERLGRDQGDPEHRDTLFFTLKTELEVHAVAEESTFYAALRDHAPARERIEAASADHDRIAEQLEELADIGADEETWLAQFRTFAATVERHVHEEETEIFALARTLLDRAQLEVLARDLVAEERRLKQAA